MRADVIEVLSLSFSASVEVDGSAFLRPLASEIKWTFTLEVRNESTADTLCGRGAAASTMHRHPEVNNIYLPVVM